MLRSELLAFFAKRRRDEIVVPTMSAYLEWPRYSSHAWDLVDGDAMGEATPVGLGLALAQPERQVWVFHGDGAQLMALGSLVTVASQQPANLYIFIFRNDCYEITGGQPIPGVGVFSFPKIARGAGIKRVYAFEQLGDFEAQFDEIIGSKGPAVVDLKTDGR
jgi:thiamine pyrophosphate-dependent acetolactate synthase large subunit-like protein